MSLTDKLKNPNQVLDTGKRSNPLWDGPSGTGPNGGITFTMLSRFLSCRERFRIQYLEGLQVRDTFNHRLEFGNMWHICEEALAASGVGIAPNGNDTLASYCNGLSKKYPLARQEIAHWHEMCRAEFPLYTAYWTHLKQQHPTTTLLQEQVFDIPYKLPSGLIVRLRGKWDRVDLCNGKVYLGENKTKSQIDPVKIKHQLSFDLQTLMYLTAMQGDQSYLGDIKYPIVGVRYNIVRRSAHKSPESMLKKIQEDVANGRGGEWFSRWVIDITSDDIQTFKEQCLNPILEGLCDWYGWATSVDPAPEEYGYGIHYRTPFGIFNPMMEGGSSEYDDYLATGSTDGLERTDKLFRELT